MVVARREHSAMPEIKRNQAGQPAEMASADKKNTSYPFWYYYVVIFITGAITLSLELICSRILRPYFGDSLVIWSGILAVTLLALALGYYCGGIQTRVSGRIEFLFSALPL